MVPKQLANTIEFIVERPAPAIGAVVAIVMAPPARWRNSRVKGRKHGFKECKRRAGPNARFGTIQLQYHYRGALACAS
jgi:hypothetical protein